MPSPRPPPPPPARHRDEPAARPHRRVLPRSARRSRPAGHATGGARGGALGLAPSSADRAPLRGYAAPVPPGHAASPHAERTDAAASRPAAVDSGAAMEPAAAQPTRPSRRTGAPRRRRRPSQPTPPNRPSEQPSCRGARRTAAAGPDSAAPLGLAAVLGAPAAAVPVAAACAGELRARARAVASVLCVSHGGEMPAGATTPAVRRLAARLATGGLPATACGRLAWVALDAEPRQAAEQVERCRALAGVPLVLAIAGPRAPAFEPLLADAELAVAVLPAEADDALRVLAVATLPSRDALVLPPLPPGPPRWAAMAGLARLRSLKAVPR